MYQLEKFGSFFVGGREIEVTGEPVKTITRNPQFITKLDPNGTYTIEQLYVQYFLPKAYQQIVVLIHGGGHTGAVWDTTPDGREGWMQLLLCENIGVYVVDTVERGRAGWCSIPNIWPGEPEKRTHQITWDAFRFGAPENFSKRIPFLKQQFPLEAFDTFMKYDVPRWNCNADASAQALMMLLQQIGTCSLVAHSQGADIALKTFNLIPNHIKNILLLEPAAFQNVTVPTQDTQFLMMYGDYIESHQMWSFLQQKGNELSTHLNHQGFTSDVLSLPTQNIFGNSHMLMMDKNNQEVFNLAREFI